MGHTEKVVLEPRSGPSKTIYFQISSDIMKRKILRFPPQRGVRGGGVSRTEELAYDSCSGPCKTLQFRILSKYDENKKLEILPPPQVWMGGGRIILQN